MLLALAPGGTEQERQQSGDRKGDDETGAKQDERGEGRGGAVRRKRVDGEAGGNETHAHEDAQLDAGGPPPLRRTHTRADVWGRVHGGYTRGRTCRAKERSPSISSRSSH